MPRNTQVRIGVLGAGKIGQRHATIISKHSDCILAGIADPSPSGKELACKLSVSHYSDLSALIDGQHLDGIVISTPNAMHVQNALECIQARIPVLIEKPLAVNTASGQELVDAAEREGVALLLGHHRRHSSLVLSAKKAIVSGLIGQPVMVNAQCWLMKPQDYFEPEWRRKEGAGPVLTNMIHDIDLLRYLCGDVETVQAMQSNGVRGFEIEDSAVAILKFRNGTLATISVSDTAVAPWSWELTSTENRDYPSTGQFCYLIAGTKGALEIPNLRYWKNPSRTGWYEPLNSNLLDTRHNDPLVEQIRHFTAVIRNDEIPLVNGHDGLAALEILDAVKIAAKTGNIVFLKE